MVFWMEENCGWRRTGIFLHWKLHDESYQCIPVIFKPFVAPLKRKTIPRLELLGCLALAKICNTCQEELSFVNFKDFDKTFWTDSRKVLSWIKTTPREFRPFVSVRVTEIQETVGPEQFRYIKSKCNPADAPTRGIAPGDLKSWMSGPPFLKLPETEWPQFQDDDQSPYKEREDALKERLHRNKLTRGKKTLKTFMPHPSHREGRATPSFAIYWKDVQRSQRYAESILLLNVQDTANGSLTVQELMQAELQLLKWSQKHMNEEPRQEVDRQYKQRGANQSPWPPRKCQNPPERHEKPSCVADDPPLIPPALQTRTLRLQESGARSKTKVLDHRAQEDGQGCCKQLCPLTETAQKTPRSVDGPSAKFTSGSWIPPFSNTAMDIFEPLGV